MADPEAQDKCMTLRVSHVSDDLKVKAENKNSGDGPAEWQFTVKGKIHTAAGLVITKGECGKEVDGTTNYLPEQDIGGKAGMSYCLMSKCDTFKGWHQSGFATKSWTGSLLISASKLSFRTLKSSKSVDAFNKTHVTEVSILQKTGDKCPTLKMVTDALRSYKGPVLTDYDWPTSNLVPTPLATQKRLGYPKKCLSKKEQEYNQKEIDKLINALDGDTADLLAYVAFDYAAPMLLYDYVDTAIDAALPYYKTYIKVLGTFFETWQDSNFEHMGELCDCGKTGISDDCWECKRDYITNEVHCEQTAKRDKDGNCPMGSPGPSGQPAKQTYETKKKCEARKILDCPDTSPPPSN